jgi:hypothetical protein
MASAMPRQAMVRPTTENIPRDFEPEADLWHRGDIAPTQGNERRQEGFVSLTYNTDAPGSATENVAWFGAQAMQELRKLRLPSCAAPKEARAAGRYKIT